MKNKIVYFAFIAFILTSLNALRLTAGPSLDLNLPQEILKLGNVISKTARYGECRDTCCALWLDENTTYSDNRTCNPCKVEYKSGVTMKIESVGPKCGSFCMTLKGNPTA